MHANEPAIRDWLKTLHGDSDGLVHLCGTGDWTGIRTSPSDLDTAVGYVLARDQAGESGTYLRATTLTADAPTQRGARAGAAYSCSLPGLWADIDIAGPGHKHQVNRPDRPGHIPSKPTIMHPLPADEAAGRAIVDEARLPAPTLWVHSGGGLYPWWLLDTPEQLGEDPFALRLASTLSEQWQRLLVAAGERLGLAYGAVGDLARVLRVPGTINRKDGLERPCRIIESDGPRYTFDQLGEAAAAARAASPPTPVCAPVRTLPPRPQVRPSQPTPRRAPISDSPLDAFAAATSWSDILEPHGWQESHRGGDGTVYWVRPGKSARDGHSATTGHATDGVDRMWVFSTSAGLPTDEPLSKPHVWGLLNGHGGAAGAVKQLLGMGFGTPRPATPPGSTTHLGPPTAHPGQAAPPRPASDHTAAPDGDQQWCPNPVLPGEPATPPPFPVAALPPVMRAMVEQVAGNLQVDPIMPALFALAAVSAVAAGKLNVRRNGSWHEALALYTVTVADSGERKSPVARAVFGALNGVEHAMRVEHDAAVDAAVDEQVAAREQVGHNAAMANRIEDEIARLEASRSRPPRIRLARDITPEALARELAKAGGHGAILDDEGLIFGNLSRYSNGQPNCGLLLAAHDGDEHVTARVSRDSDIIRRPTLAMGLATQPVVLDDAMRSKVLLERGFLARIIYGFPVSQVGNRFERNAAPYDPAPIVAWGAALSRVAAIPALESEDGGVQSLVLSPEALALHIGLSDEVEVRIGPSGDLSTPGVKEWAHKHAGRVLRLAALLHLAAGYGPTQEIGADAMSAAILVGGWAVEHARRAHQIGVESEEEATVDQCRQVLRWVARSGRESFTRREACRGVRAQWVSSDAMGDALDQLVELGWLREVLAMDRGGRTQRRWAVSPHVGQARMGAS